jgi:cation diffusion facilitator CzcD-associated flavoprotein CzcO
MTNSCDAIIVGAGPAGLAAAAALKARGRDTIILEKSAAVGSVWRRHYDRLHLHTDRVRSGLPGLPMPIAYGRYPSRLQVVEYLEAYAAKFALKPVFNTSVDAIRRDGSQWRVEAGAETFVAPIVVVATGLADFPHSPTWPGMNDFVGPILHSSLYRNPAPFAGKRVLVVGYGNSGAEIALDLSEADVDVALSVRSPVNIVPRELFGLPILVFPIAERWLPPRAADILNAPAIRLAVGSLAKAGLTKAAKGPLRSVAEDGRVPLIDIGTLAQIRAGRIRVRGDIANFTAKGVVFRPSGAESFDVAILATGFHPDLRTLLPEATRVLSGSGAPLVSGRATAEAGLFFCGAIVSPTGQLRQIAIEARSIADAVAGAGTGRAG